ncbi:MAM and LDL-receptor class A domain-containing protein 1-like isoform X1 [Haliotis asinina]|uniref:MAM and LDL-receptor class A domain-containing protein 1-like isoform X1 n=1 Tax=Haliotis asinina TaxID=109174 RepID=UPI003531A86D
MKRHLTTILALIASLEYVHTFPMKNGREIYPEENAGIHSVFLSEGDIVVDLVNDMFGAVRKRRQPKRRNAVRDLYGTWLNRTVPYEIQSSYDDKQRREMRMAMEEFEQKTCVRFRPRTIEPDYIRILPDGGCSSSVGRKGGKQKVSIDSNCDNKGTIMHELMHALGFWHEHSRPDRDHYITIMWDNIAKEHEDNFKSYSSDDIDTLGAPYDYGSIMHYRNNTFALDRSKPTILSKFPLPRGVVMGQREHLSDIDIVKINRLYRCNITHCPDAGFPKNGVRDGDDFRVSKTVKYKCQTGYTLVGSNARFCMDLGDWTGNFPVCLLSYKGGYLHYCNFDQGNLCGWKQDYTDEQNWTLHNRSTPSDSTGPKADHTMGTSEGYYIFLESSTPCKEGDRARLISPTFSYLGTKACLAFHYHMYGKTMGTLNVYQRIGGKNVPKFSLSDNHGTSWHMAVFVLDDSSSFQLVFEAVAGSSFKSDMAVDDIVVGSCDSLSTLVNAATPETMSCDFNSDTCGWIQAKDDIFDWTLEKDSTSTFNTGPDCDPTNCANGTYLYTESSSPRKPNDTARIATPVLKQGGGPRCLSFSYHMFGDTMGTLRVFNAELGAVPQLLWTRSGEHGNKWHREQIDLDPMSPFQIVFEGIRGTSWRSDMAIDNVDITKGECADIVQFNCNFDTDWCGWRNAQPPMDIFDWERSNHSTWTPGTGPTADHTTSTGFFVYIETSGPVAPGSVARLVSPRMTDESSGFCLEFWYHMYGRDVRTLSVLRYSLEGGGITSLWSVTGDKGNWWRRHRQTVTSSGQDFQIIFEAVSGGSLGDIAIDDVSITPGACYSFDAQVLSRRHFPFLQSSGR